MSHVETADAELLGPGFGVAARRLTRIGMSDRGGMLVEVCGRDGNGAAKIARWSLVAEDGDGPCVPVLPAAAAVRALQAGPVVPGARIAGDLLPLAAIEAEMASYALNRLSNAEEPAVVNSTTRDSGSRFAQPSA